MSPAAVAALPLWAEWLVAALVLLGAGLALLGTIGLLRLPTFFERVHAPAIISTLACCRTSSVVSSVRWSRSAVIRSKSVRVRLTVSVLPSK